MLRSLLRRNPVHVLFHATFQATSLTEVSTMLHNTFSFLFRSMLRLTFKALVLTLKLTLSALYLLSLAVALVLNALLADDTTDATPDQGADGYTPARYVTPACPVDTTTTAHVPATYVTPSCPLPPAPVPAPQCKLDPLPERPATRTVPPRGNVTLDTVNACIAMLDALPPKTPAATTTPKRKVPAKASITHDTVNACIAFLDALPPKQQGDSPKRSTTRSVPPKAAITHDQVDAAIAMLDGLPSKLPPKEAASSQPVTVKRTYAPLPVPGSRIAQYLTQALPAVHLPVPSFTVSRYVTASVPATPSVTQVDTQVTIPGYVPATYVTPECPVPPTATPKRRRSRTTVPTTKKVTPKATTKKSRKAQG